MVIRSLWGGDWCVVCFCSWIFAICMEFSLTHSTVTDYDPIRLFFVSTETCKYFSPFSHCNYYSLQIDLLLVKDIMDALNKTINDSFVFYFALFFHHRLNERTNNVILYERIVSKPNILTHNCLWKVDLP